MVGTKHQRYHATQAGDAATTSPRQGSASDRTSVELGVAISTRNYSALLQNHRILNNQADHVPKEDEDKTVLGLAINTRNYAALVAVPPVVNVRDVRMAEQRRVGMDRLSSPSSVNSSPMTAQSVAMATYPNDEEEDDDGVVLALPLNSRNYLPLNANGEPLHRNRGYSRLNQSPSTSAPDLGIMGAVHSPAQGNSDPYNVAPGVKNVPQGRRRSSCFEKASNAAVVPHAGWLYVQHGALNSWKRYYAVLSGLDFKYCKNVGQPPKGFGVIQAVDPWPDVPFGLTISFAAQKPLNVYCEGENEYKEWVEMTTKALERSDTTHSHSKTSYTVTAGQHEGYLYKQERNKQWKLYYFVVRIDGYLQCQESETNSAKIASSSGFIRSVSYDNVREHSLSIQLDAGRSLFVYADSYDDKMFWYGAMSTAASASGQASRTTSSVKSPYIQAAWPNHSGWLYKQKGFFKSWKRMFFTLHGKEFSCSPDTNSLLDVCDRMHSVEEWDGKPNGLMIRMKSGRIWKVYAESFESAKHWRTVITNTIRHGEHESIEKYVARRKKRNLPCVFAGWLTKGQRNGPPLRQFYVIDGSTIGYANDVDHQLQSLGEVIEVGASKDLNCGIVITLSNGQTMKVAADSISAQKSWYIVLHAACQRRSTH